MTQVKKIKTFKSLDEQVEILKSKGLIIKDIEYTKSVLLRENYFFVNGYRTVFYREDGSRRFIEGTTFEELYSLFLFDRQFRNIIFKNLLIVENNYKSIFSYVMSKHYGIKEKEYLNHSNFTHDKSKARQINDLIRKLKRQIRINGRQHRAVSHYMDNYGFVPMWVGVKVLSFGLICELYSVLKKEDRESIANYYNIDPDDFEIYLPILSNFRNLCAHEDMLYNHRTQRSIPDTKYHSILSIKKGGEENQYLQGKNDLFSLIIILKKLLTANDFKMMMNEINYEFEFLDGRINIIENDKIRKIMGFPENYKDIMYIE